MRIVIQRVKEASVTIDGKLHSAIGQGMLILIGVEDRDGQEDVEWLVKKTAQLRIFDDENGVMNRSVVDIAGEGPEAVLDVLGGDLLLGWRGWWGFAAQGMSSVHVGWFIGSSVPCGAHLVRGGPSRCCGWC